MRSLRGPVLAILAACWLASACSRPPTVEQKVIAVIQEMASRVEAGERRAFISHVAEDFSGQGAIMTRDQLGALVLYQLNKNRRVSVSLMPIHVTTETPGEAEADFQMLLTGGQGLLPERGQLFDVETHWRESDGEWILSGASWEAVSLEAILD